MTIDSAGNVVIGNTSTVNSAYKLDVKGDVRTQGDIVPYSMGNTISVVRAQDGIHCLRKALNYMVLPLI